MRRGAGRRCGRTMIEIKQRPGLGQPGARKSSKRKRVR
jgi:hypothetical protein